jgi:hypothetical protein
MALEKIEKYLHKKWGKNFEYEIYNPKVIKNELEKIMKLRNRRKTHHISHQSPVSGDFLYLVVKRDDFPGIMR